jgi:hypothetical protein
VSFFIEATAFISCIDFLVRHSFSLCWTLLLCLQYTLLFTNKFCWKEHFFMSCTVLSLSYRHSFSLFGEHCLKPFPIRKWIEHRYIPSPGCKRSYSRLFCKLQHPWVHECFESYPLLFHYCFCVIFWLQKSGSLLVYLHARTFHWLQLLETSCLAR